MGRMKTKYDVAQRLRGVNQDKWGYRQNCKTRYDRNADAECEKRKQ